MRNTILLVVLVTTSSITPVSAGTQALLEATTADAVIQGRVAASDKNVCYLLGRDGKLHQLPVSRIKKLKRIEPKFRGFSTAEMRDQLRKELGGKYEIVGSGAYLVCAAKGQARKYARSFDQTYRSFRSYFSVRGFTLAKPEFPLVAIVFPSRKEFAEYCKKDGLMASSRVAGYYLHSSNRIALFDRPQPQASVSPAGERLPQLFASKQLLARGQGSGFRIQDSMRLSESPALPKPWLTDDGRTTAHFRAAVSADVLGTMIHEATHQAAFNTGLHSRVGESPTWVVEGLATVFEAPGIRNRPSKSTAQTRINYERFIWFRNFAKSRRKDKSLADFVSRDMLYKTATLDAYSQGWALSFFLIETRPSEYVRFLKKIAARDPLARYTKQQRLADFKAVFGTDVNWLEVNFLRYMNRLDLDGKKKVYTGTKTRSRTKRRRSGSGTR